jgi:ferrochelatase
MGNGRNSRTGVILLSMGGPNRPEDIPSFLYNIFSDRTLIRLPGGALFQKPLAKLISHLRSKKVEANYRLIGGGSPLLKWTRSQADHIQTLAAEEGLDISCYIGMRYFHPLIPETIEDAVGDGCRRLIFLPLYPQYSAATTGSSFEAARKALRRHEDIEAVYIRDFHDNSAYIQFLAARIEENIRPDETLLFSAHALPQRFVDDGDPYVDQVRKCTMLAAGDREHYLAFQSRTGPVKWVGPDTVDEVRRLLEEGRKLFIVPISFVCDHIETLFEIDIDLPERMKRLGIEPRIRRMPMFNDDTRFSRVLLDVIRKDVPVHVPL